MFVQIPDDGIYTVASLAVLQQSGWRLVFLFSVQESVQLGRVVPSAVEQSIYAPNAQERYDVSGQPLASAPGGHAVAIETTFAWRTRYLLRKEVGDVVERLHDDIALLQKELAKSRAKATDIEGRVKELEEDLAHARKDVAAWADSQRDAQRRAEDLARSGRKLEEDLGKIRQAFGKIQVDKVLGE